MGDYYEKGTHNAICDRCGLEFKAHQLRKTWDGLYVCKHDFEHRHPQERLRPTKDIQKVEWVRSDPTVFGDIGDNDVTLTVGDDINQWYGTDLTANRTVTLSTTGASNGDIFYVVRTGHGDYTLDIGGLFTITNPVAEGYAKVRFNGSSWVLSDSGIL